jgi:hypothetical protein
MGKGNLVVSNAARAFGAEHWPWLFVAGCAIASGLIAQAEFDLYLESLVLTHQ